MQDAQVTKSLFLRNIFEFEGIVRLCRNEFGQTYDTGPNLRKMGSNSGHCPVPKFIGIKMLFNIQILR